MKWPGTSASRGRLAGGLFCAVGLIVIACVGLRTISTSEVWLHLAAGRWTAEHGLPHKDPFSFTRENASWVNTTWLYDRALFALWRLGDGAAATGLNVVLIVSTFALLWPVARRWAGPIASGMALLLAAWLLAPRLDVRPAVAALLVLAWFVNRLTIAHSPWVLWATLLPAQILWANVHPSFLGGPALALLFAADRILEERLPKDPATGPGPLLTTRSLSLLLLVLALLIVNLFNPYGWALYRAAPAAWLHPAQRYVAEWVSPFSDQFASNAPRRAVYLALAVAAAGLLAQRRRLPSSLTTLAVVGAFLVVVRSMAHVDFFAVAVFPFLALSLSAVGESAAGWLDRSAASGTARWGAQMMAAASLVLAAAFVASLVTNDYYVSVGSVSRFGLGVEYGLFPEKALDAIQRDDFPDCALNLAADGGFLAWRAPARKVFVDSRAELYGTDFYKSLNDGLLRGDPEKLEALLQQWKPGAVILNATARHSVLALRNLLMGGRWAFSYFDGTTALLLQPVSTYADLIHSEQLQRAGLQALQEEAEAYRQQLQAGKRPGVPARLVGAASVFLGLGRYREAGYLYGLLTRGAPNMAVAWLNLGICQNGLGQHGEAVAALEEACRRWPKNALAWLWLSRAYANMGLEKEARRAFEKGKRLSPPTAEAFGDPLKKASS